MNFIGTTTSEEQGYKWQDVHIQRFIGDITIDTTQTILPQGKSIIVIQQAFGKVRVIVPYEVTIQLHYSTLYGEATCLNYAPKQARMLVKPRGRLLAGQEKKRKY